jgi:hypothetical protein
MWRYIVPIVALLILLAFAVWGHQEAQQPRRLASP